MPWLILPRSGSMCADEILRTVTCCESYEGAIMSDFLHSKSDLINEWIRKPGGYNNVRIETAVAGNPCDDVRSAAQYGAFPQESGLLVYLDSLEQQVRKLTAELYESNVKLKLSQTRFNLAISNSSVIVFDQDQELRYNWIFNPPAGFCSDYFRGRTDDDVFYREEAQCLSMIKRQVMESGTAARHQVNITSSGEISCYDLTIQPVYDEDGKLIGINGMALDITNYKQVEQQLQQLSALMDLAHDAIIICDLDSHIVHWNKGCETLYGWTADEATGQISHILLQTQFPDSMAATHKALIETGYWENELTHINRMGMKVIVCSRQVLLHNENGDPVSMIEVNKDITLRKQYEEELRQAGRKLQQNDDDDQG